MEKFEIDINLEHIADQRKAWNEASRAFGEAVDKALTRLIHEAAAQRLSVQYVASKAGFTSHQIKSRMKAMGLNPTTGKALLSKQAAAVLESNAEILGIKPSEIDLMSPLAYLPAGPLLKHETSDVHEFPETPVHELMKTLALLSARGQTVVEVDGEHYDLRVDLNAEDQPVLTEYSLGLLVKAAQQREAGA